jgi:hypothetical protein
MKRQRQTPARRIMMDDSVIFVSDGTLLPRGEYVALTTSASRQPELALLLRHAGRVVAVGAVGYRPRGAAGAAGASWHYADE